MVTVRFSLARRMGDRRPLSAGQASTKVRVRVRGEQASTDKVRVRVRGEQASTDKVRGGHGRLGHVQSASSSSSSSSSS